MRLREITPQTPIFQFQCSGCYSPCGSDANGAKADLDGPSFQSYYCPDCVSELKAADEQKAHETLVRIITGGDEK